MDGYLTTEPTTDHHRHHPIPLPQSDLFCIRCVNNVDFSSSISTQPHVCVPIAIIRWQELLLDYLSIGGWSMAPHTHTVAMQSIWKAFYPLSQQKERNWFAIRCCHRKRFCVSFTPFSTPYHHPPVRPSVLSQWMRLLLLMVIWG